MDLTNPSEITYDTTPSGCRRAVARYPLSLVMQAAFFPDIVHEGVTYVPFTGTVITAARAEKAQRPVGYYMEYRALRPSAPLPA